MKPHEHVILEIARERERQINVEGFDAAHDDEQWNGTLSAAAACYARFASDKGHLRKPNNWPPPFNWPWAPEWWKPKDERHDLIRAAALIVAEIDRLDRASEQARSAAAGQSDTDRRGG